MRELAKSEKQALLKWARDSLSQHLNKNVGEDLPAGRPNPSVSSDSSENIPLDQTLQEKAGVFVTLHQGTDLRGCIGRLQAKAPLQENIAEMAIAAGTQDPRFPAVTLEELESLHFELSVLSPFEEITHLEQIEVGQHGLYLTEGMHSGLLLPQVAVEWSWDREDFLSHTCLKAQLPQDRWKQWPDQKLKIEIFMAQVFGERE